MSWSVSHNCLTLSGRCLGYRGCGVNWHGWFPPDAGTDASRHNALVFHVRQLTMVAGADLTVHLADNVKRPDGANPSNAVEVVADGGLEKIDGTWRVYNEISQVKLGGS